MRAGLPSIIEARGEEDEALHIHWGTGGGFWSPRCRGCEQHYKAAKRYEAEVKLLRATYFSPEWVAETREVATARHAKDMRRVEDELKQVSEEVRRAGLETWKMKNPNG